MADKPSAVPSDGWWNCQISRKSDQKVWRFRQPSAICQIPNSKVTIPFDNSVWQFCQNITQIFQSLWNISKSVEWNISKSVEYIKVCEIKNISHFINVMLVRSAWTGAPALARLHWHATLALARYACTVPASLNPLASLALKVVLNAAWKVKSSKI